MHRYVDLHYQYLTSSYACMLSCPISLRPFVILEGTGLGPPGAQGQTEGGLCHQHPCGGSDLPSLQYICWIQTTNKVKSIVLFTDTGSSVNCMKSVLSGWNINSNVELSSCQKWKIFFFTVDFNHLKMPVCHLVVKVHKHVFLRSVNTLNNQHLVFI